MSKWVDWKHFVILYGESQAREMLENGEVEWQIVDGKKLYKIEPEEVLEENDIND